MLSFYNNKYLFAIIVIFCDHLCSVSSNSCCFSKYFLSLHLRISDYLSFLICLSLFLSGEEKIWHEKVGFKVPQNRPICLEPKKAKTILQVHEQRNEGTNKWTIKRMKKRTNERANKTFSTNGVSPTDEQTDTSSICRATMMTT